MAHWTHVAALTLCSFLSVTQNSWGKSQVEASPKPHHSASQEASSSLSKGLGYLEQARYDEAIAAFRQALTLDPNLTTARYDLGVAYLSTGQFAEAKRTFQEVLASNPDHAFSRYFLARIDLIEGNLDEAIHGLQSLRSSKPVADELYYLGSAHLKKGDTREAISALQQAAILNPNDYRIPLLLARTYHKTGQEKEAENQAALSETLRDSYRRKSREILDCNTALNSQPRESAVHQCAELLDGVDPTKLVSFGVLLAERQMFNEAIGPLRRASLLDTENYEPHFNLGLTYFKMKRYKEAKEPLEKAVNLRPESYDALALLGSVLFALGEDYSALSHLRHAHQLRPTEEKVSGLLFEQLRIVARHLIDQQSYRESIAYLQEALALRPNELELQSQLAQATAALRNNDLSKP